MAPVPPYRLSLKSQEQRGASKPNIVELGFASDADANTFAANLALVCAAYCVSVDHELSSNYATPYPAGKDAMSRTALTDGNAHFAQMVIFDTPDAFAPATRGPALVAAGMYLVEPDLATTYAVSAANIQVFNPANSV